MYIHKLIQRWSEATELQRLLGLDIPGFGCEGNALKRTGMKVLTAFKPTDPALVAWRYDRVAALLEEVVARREVSFVVDQRVGRRCKI